MPPALTIRKAEPSELPIVDGLRTAAAEWLASKGLDQWQPDQPRLGTRDTMLEAINRGTCYLAFVGRQLAGTITLDTEADPEFWTPAEQAEPALYIHRMIIDRRYSGRQLGAELLAFAHDLAQREGAQRLRLDAWKTNPELHAYYVGQGFEHVRTVSLPHRGSEALFQRPVPYPERRPHEPVAEFRS